jgi:Homeodomain-like domain
VERYRKVRLARREGMSERAAARHFGISRESVKKIMSFSVPPGCAVGGRCSSRCTTPPGTPRAISAKPWW